MTTTVNSFQNSKPKYHRRNNNTKNTKNSKRSRNLPNVVSAEKFYFENVRNHVGFGFLDKMFFDVLENLLAVKVLCCAKDTQDDVTHLPSFEVGLGELMMRIEGYLGLKGIQTYLGGCRIVGSAAQCILRNEEVDLSAMNDLDLTFYLVGDASQRFPDVCRAMQELVVGFISENQEYVSYEDVSKYYLRDFNWIETSQDTWCLCSLGNGEFSIDIKFIWSLSRRYCFSLNSFEIIVDDLLHKLKVEKIPVECTFGDFETAVGHLIAKTLYTHNPEMIFRGCFRYCLQLSKGNTPASENRATYDTEFSRNFWSTFGWGSTGYFRKILCRFIENHPHDKLNFLRELAALIKIGSDLRQDEFLDIVLELTQTIFQLQVV